VAVPEISAYTVHANNHARFVLASDGFWDVVSVEDVRRVGLSAAFVDPRELASHLANKALRRRERAKMRADDITCLVVDINPASFVSVDSVADDMLSIKPTGCCTVS
jgi:serine/threonine protein phosphatase PrpC